MKKILFVIESLVCAGAEKSLVTLLNLIDYSKYEVDLQLFSLTGEFLPLVPQKVNILDELPYFKETHNSLKSMVFKRKTTYQRKVIKSRLAYSLSLRIKKYTNPQQAVIFWKYASKCFEIYNKDYDIAIAYAQGVPTFYVADCINAKKKIAWVNSIYTLESYYNRFALCKYQNYDKIVCVSESGQQNFVLSFSSINTKTTVIYDINDGKFIEKLSKNDSSAASEMSGEIKLLTIGRFAIQKGYDIALGACKILKSRGFKFFWYVLGQGPLESEIINRIRKFNIEDNFILLGVRSNPYPYINNADIYVQTSRFEGFGLAIAEARILNIPVVTTNFDSVYAQMINGENGLVVDMTPEAVADGIQKLIEDKELYNHIVEYQKSEKKRQL